MVMFIGVINSKGGTGKTNTCRSLGRGLQKRGFKVSMADCDPQRALMEWRAKDEHSEQPEVSMINGRMSLLEAAERAQEDDFFLVDGLAGNFEITMMIVEAADLVILPVQPSPDDVNDLASMAKLITMNQAVRQNLPVARVLLNGVIRNASLNSVIREAVENEGLALFDSEIVRREAYRQAAAAGGTIYDYTGDSFTSGMVDFDSLISEIIESCQ
ncbi:MAG: AAA family ATPase [Gammaproteobacteria bacterium]|nr:AAA family ATPase [Gammaproteobacteria bacterium]